MAASAEPRLGSGIVVSVMLHAGLLAALFLLRPGAPPPSPQVFKLDLIAAPAGPRAAGVVRDQSQPTPPAPAPAPTTTKTTPSTQKKPPVNQKTKTVKTPTVATPQSPTKPPEKVKPEQAPTAGGGATGGTGADVANIRTEGLDFPYPEYLKNIVRKVIQRFQPRLTQVAEVQFIIHRDGSVDLDGIRVTVPSKSYDFNQQALAAVEAAAAAKDFGPLPPGFREDILPVTLRFSPTLIR